MSKTLVYDLPTRMFHWLFAGLFVTAFIIAKTVDDESPVFSYHMMFGMTLSTAVVFRVIWGFIGSPYARFSSFELSPRKLFQYFKDLFSSKSQFYAGHNPASSFAAVGMILAALGLGVTGYLMATQDLEAVEDLHEVLANLLLFMAVGHVAGVILHTIKHRDPIGLSMISGRKNVDPTQGISSVHRFAALVFLVIVVSVAGQLFKNFDPQTRTTQAFGLQLQLGEAEENEGSEKGDSKGELKEGGGEGREAQGDDD